MWAAYFSKASETWSASSRVGARTSACGVFWREVELRQDRQREGGRLAGAGLGQADDVAALEERRDGRGLDLRGGLVADVRQRLEDLRREAEVGEGLLGCYGLVVTHPPTVGPQAATGHSPRPPDKGATSPHVSKHTPLMRDAMPDLPEGLTTRPLQRSDAHDVFVLMAAQEQEDIGHVAIEEADIVSDWAKPSHDLGARSIGVWDGDTLVAYAELMGADRADTSVLPSHRGRGIGTWLAHWLRRPRPQRRLVGRRHARPAGLAGRPAARGARLPGPVDQLGAQAARGRHRPRAHAAGGLRRPHGGARRAARRPRRPGGRLPRVVGARPGDVRGLRRRDQRPARVRAVEPAGGRSTRTAPSSASRWSSCRTTGRRRTSTGSPYDATSATAGSPRPCSSTRSPAGASTARRTSELSTDSRTGALPMYERVGMVVDHVWVNRGIELG